MDYEQLQAEIDLGVIWIMARYGRDYLADAIDDAYRILDLSDWRYADPLIVLCRVLFIQIATEHLSDED